MESTKTSLQYIVHLGNNDTDIESDTVSQSFDPLRLTNNLDEKEASRVIRVDRTVAMAQKRRHSRPAAAYPRKRATQACHTCRFRRTKCDNSRPACASFDPASLAILKRIDDLECLLQAKVAEPLPIALSNRLESTSPLAPHSDLASSVVDLRTYWRRSCINVDAVLRWPVFADQDFPSRLHPVSLAEDDKAHSELTAMPMSVDVDLPAAESLLRNFFDNVHIFNPILDEEDVREYMKSLLIYAHGSIAAPLMMETVEMPPAAFHRSSAFYQAQSYFVAAQKRMGMLLSQSGVIEAQCFFLAGAYLMTTFRPVEAWKMFTQALACCHGFSIHQDATSARSGDEWSPKQRIYWTCFKSELELRLELNLQQKDVSDLTYPTFFPSPPEGLKTQDEAAWYFYLAEIALRRLRNRVLSYLCRAETCPESEMQQAVLDFEEQIDAWLQSLPEALALDIPHPEKEQPEALRFILNGHVLDCQEAMYWPFVVDALHGRLHGNSGEFFLRKGMKVCVDRIQQNRKGFYHRHHGTWLMLRSCTRSAFVLLAAVRRADLVSFLPVGLEEAVMDVTRMLQFWKDERSADVYEMLAALEMLIDARVNC
ncbi:hypothetical protein V1525DRAFT_420403 [Lipomyces kononenkoae]|uniref:Uncharacterized protein n=1 Tax=Lipomyces kononenkoae TaxID=34357 RepID=A0ACC3SXU5_LIPKO